MYSRIFRASTAAAVTSVVAMCAPGPAIVSPIQNTTTSTNTLLTQQKPSLPVHLLPAAMPFRDSNPDNFIVPPAAAQATDAISLTYVLRAALMSTGEMSMLEATQAVTSGDDVEHLSRAVWSYHEGSAPTCCVVVRSSMQVAAIVRTCAAHNVSVIARAGGTSLEGQTVPSRNTNNGLVCVMDVSLMNRVLRVNAADLSADVEPGVGWQELDLALKPYGLMFPVDPGPGAKVGGMCGTNCSGTHACRFGAMKANVLGLEVIAADGSRVRTGCKARKTSAGLDLTSLYIGAEGTLGVIVRATLRLAPRPTHTRVAVTSFKSVEDACGAVAAAVSIGVSLAAAELLDAKMAGAINARDPTLLPDSSPSASYILWKCAGGGAAAVADDMARVKVVANKHGSNSWCEAIGDEAADALWEARKTALISVAAAHPDARVLTTDVCVPLSALPGLLKDFEFYFETAAAQSQTPLVSVYAVAHAADGNAHHFITFDAHDSAATAHAHALAEWLARAAIARGGTCTGEHGVGSGKLKYLATELGEGNARVTRAIKRALDPRGILNPGKKIPLIRYIE